MNQTNPEPAGATFSDFSRSTTATQSGVSGIYGTQNWSTSASLDPAIFASFSIQAAPGQALALSQLTFDSLKNGSATLNAQVSLFLNGSATPYASFSWTPTNAPMTSYVFNFAPITAADNVTAATFRFYAWNASDWTNEVQFDNVATFGSIAVVPESSAIWAVAVVMIAIAQSVWMRLKIAPETVRRACPKGRRH